MSTSEQIKRCENNWRFIIANETLYQLNWGRGVASKIQDLTCSVPRSWLVHYHLCPAGSNLVARTLPIAVLRKLHSKNAVALIEVAFDITAV